MEIFCSLALFKMGLIHTESILTNTQSLLVFIAGDMYFASAAENVQVYTISCIWNDKLKFRRNMSPYILYTSFCVVKRKIPNHICPQ